jgi:hypothetical protein
MTDEAYPVLREPHEVTDPAARALIGIGLRMGWEYVGINEEGDVCMVRTGRDYYSEFAPNGPVREILTFLLSETENE